MSEYYAGKDCKCSAYGESECCCDVDCTDPEVYRLRKALEEIDEIGRIRNVESNPLLDCITIWNITAEALRKTE